MAVLYVFVIEIMGRWSDTNHGHVVYRNDGLGTILLNAGDIFIWGNVYYHYINVCEGWAKAENCS
jgi:hypothetical protein